MKTIRLLFALLLGLTACAPKVSTKISKSFAALDANQPTYVFGLEEQVPQDSEELGTIKIGDNGLSVNCTFEEVIERAKQEARKVGGNAVKITRHLPPDAWTSTCHRISATILKVNNYNAVLASSANMLSVNEADTPQAEADYALLHIYRFGGIGSLVNYNLYLDDSVICRVKSGWKQTVKVKKNGPVVIWAKTEKRTEIPINIQLGNEYYIRCGIDMGMMVGRPSIQFIDKATGKIELQSIKVKAVEQP